MSHAIHWFEIPASDLARARKFYNEILGVQLADVEMPGCTMCMFPCGDGVGGAIVKQEGHQPSDQGTLVYLNGGADLQAVLSRVEGAGGEVLLPKTSIGEHGFCALFRDTEGNRVGLHSQK